MAQVKKILEKLDKIINEQPDDLIFHVESNDHNDHTNNVNLLINVKKIFNKVSKE